MTRLTLILILLTVPLAFACGLLIPDVLDMTPAQSALIFVTVTCGLTGYFRASAEAGGRVTLP